VKAQAQACRCSKVCSASARRALRGLGKHQLAQLGEQRGGQAQQAIGQQQAHGHHQQRRRVARLDVHAIDQVLSSTGTPTLASLAPTMKQRRQHAPA
jgi:hypothetical protein